MTQRRNKRYHPDPSALPADVAEAHPPESQKGPRSLLDFHRMFPDEQACADFLFKMRWPEGFVCPKCGDTRAYPIKDRGLIECGKGHQTSVTAGTAMHRSKQPLLLWFHAAYLVSTLTPGISAVQFQKQLGLKRYETAFQMLHKLRASLVAPDRESLRGEVEVDEAFVGGTEEGRPGRGAETKALVVIGVEIVHYVVPDPHDPDNPDAGIERTRAGRVRLNVIPDAAGETLLPWCVKNIEKGTTVKTDGWSGYNGLAKLGYDHVRVLQSRKGHKTGAYLPMVHLIISNLKRWLLGTHKGAVLPHHLPAYLNEFTFRFNRRFWRGPAFLRALGLMTGAEKWPEYDALYGIAKEAPGAWMHPNPSVNARVQATLSKVRADLIAGGHAEVVGWMDANDDAVWDLVGRAIEGRDDHDPLPVGVT